MTQEQLIIDFADKYLYPYRIKYKSDGQEIVPDLCPICNGGNSGDKHTFALSVEKGCFVCKRGSCGANGRVEELFKMFGEELKGAKRKNVLMKQPKIQRFDIPKVELLPPTQEIYDYFAKRQISKETVDAFKIAADKKGMIVFPFYENNVLTFVKYRRPYRPSPEEAKKSKEWRDPNTKAILFHMDDCVFDQPLYITEGQIDAMSLYEAGIQNVVSVPSGCDDTSWIENCFDWLEKFDQIVLFGDNDTPGRKMVQEVVKRLDESRCFIVEEYPNRPDGTPCKDANEILYFCGPFELEETANSAEAVPLKGILDLAEVEPIDPTTIPRIQTKIPALDETLGGLVEGGITVFTGRAGDGKSTLTGLLLLNAIEQGQNVCAYSGELRKEKFQEWINLQAAGSDYIGLKFDKIRGKEIPIVSWEVQKKIAEWYHGHFYLFDNNEIFESNQSESILNVFTMAHRRFGCKLFLVDNLMTSLSDSDEETKAQSKFVNALKKFATRYGVHVLIVAHPRKTKQGEQLKKDDVGGASAIVNLADSAIVVERPNLRIIKNREGGVQKLIECCYCGDSRRIYQADKGDLNYFSWDRSSVKPLPADQRASAKFEYGIQFASTEPF